MQGLHVDECVKSAMEQISLRAFSGIFKNEFNLHLGHPNLNACKFRDEWATEIEVASTSDESSRLRGEHKLHIRVVRSAG
jgi:hypothetical protein